MGVRFAPEYAQWSHSVVRSGQRAETQLMTIEYAVPGIRHPSKWSLVTAFAGGKEYGITEQKTVPVNTTGHYKSR